MILKDLHTLILDRLPDFSRQVALAGRYVVDHPDDVLVFSMRDMATRAGVSAATFQRLTQVLKLEGWAEFRAIHVANLRQVPEAYVDRANRALDHPEMSSLLNESFASHRSNLDFTMAINKPEVFARAAQLLAEADRVFVSAFMSCRGPGLTFAYLCRMLRNDVSFLGDESSSLCADLAMLRPGSVVLSINFHPYGKEMDMLASKIEESGATLICLSDSHATPIARLSNETLIYAVEGPSFFPSLTAVHALVESLIVSLLAHLGEPATDRIRRIEASLYDSGAYSSTTTPKNEK